MRRKRIAVWFIMIMMFLLLPIRTYAATPIIKKTEAWPTNCYFHYDGKIYVYSTSRYKTEVKKAVKLLNKKFNVFRITTSKTKRDVLIRDGKKPPKKNVIAVTQHYNGTITLFQKNMKRLNKTDKVLSIAHELGHTAGLNHASSRKSLMYPYVNKLKIKGLSKADVAALKKAKKIAGTDNKKRKEMRSAFLVFEEYRRRIPLTRGAFVLSFPKRGITYKSSNTSILEVYQTGVVLVKKPGNVILTVNNGGEKHKFRITVID